MYEEKKYNDYETHFCSAYFSHSLEKDKHACRRKSSAIKKRNRKAAVKEYGVAGYYIQSQKPIYSTYETQIIPKYTVTFFRNGIITQEEIPEKRIKTRKLLGYQEVTPYLKRINISSRRKYAKRRTNEKMRCGKAFLRDEIASNPSAYRKTFEYAYEIY